MVAYVGRTTLYQAIPLSIRGRHVTHLPSEVVEVIKAINAWQMHQCLRGAEQESCAKQTL